jgi:hypothetical protein
MSVTQPCSPSFSENADADSRLDIRVFCQSQTKKKGKRKKEVAATTVHSLGQLLKKQELDRSETLYTPQAVFILLPLE